MAAGHAACFTSTLAVIGRETKIDTGAVLVTTEIGIGKDLTDGGFQIAGALRVKLPAYLRGETGRKLVEQAHAACPHSKATRGNLPVELVVE